MFKYKYFSTSDIILFISYIKHVLNNKTKKYRWTHNK